MSVLWQVFLSSLPQVLARPLKGTAPLYSESSGLCVCAACWMPFEVVLSTLLANNDKDLLNRKAWP